jgi:hypothetical protein
MTRKTVKPTFSIAMSMETGCIVMTRTNGQKVTVIGSVPREQSCAFANELLEWMPEGAPVAEPDKPRLPYNH